MKKSVAYPDWAEKYRGKGRTIRKVRDGYGLYQCTSVYQPGQNYPKSVQKYLGMITKKDGFIPKKSAIPAAPSSGCLEYGLSHFIMTNFKRDLYRSIYSNNEQLVILAVIQYIFGDPDEVFIRSSYLCTGKEDELLERLSKGISPIRMKKLTGRIDSLVAEKIPDEKERNIMTKLLLLTVISENTDPKSVIYPPRVSEIAEKYGVKL